MYSYFFIIVFLLFLVVIQYIKINKFKNIYSKMSKLVDNSPLMIWVKDQTGKTMFLNRLCKENHIFEECIENDKSIIGKKLAGIIDGKIQKYQFEKEFIKDEKIRYYDNIFFSIKNRKGEIIGSAGVSFDITEKHEKEKYRELKENILEKIREAIIITDKDLNILETNKAFSKITGYSIFDVQDKKIDIINYEILNKEFLENILVKNSNEGKWEGEIIAKDKFGKNYPVWISLNSTKDKMGNITNFVFIIEDLTEIKNTKDNIDKLTYYDVLTGVPNQILFQERLNNIIQNTKDYPEMFAILRLDIDNFNIINDSFGFETGNYIIKESAKRIKREIKENDIIARISGDEFVIILSDIKKAEDAALFSQKILNIFRTPFEVDAKEIFLGISIGIVIYPEDAVIADELIKKSSKALFYAKNQGKNNYQFYLKELNRSSLERIEMEAALRHGLEKEEFLLFYQPQIDIITGKIIGAEALIRWQTENKEIISPAKFIPLAEENGIIIPLGEWVIYTACAQNRLWQEKYGSNITISVNVSPLQMKQPNFVEKIKKILITTELEASYLELEITEGMLMENRIEILNKIDTLKDMGIKIAIDDFGTGYSSLGYLKRFPIDKLKIDQRFIRDIPIEDNGAIAKVVIALGKSLNMKVIAEGVETKSQVEFLKNNMCNEIQGYFYGKPMPASDFEKYLEKYNKD